MRKPPPDYDAIERERWSDNLNEVDSRLQADDSYIAKRIDTFVGRFGFAVSDVKAKIRGDRMFAAHFAIEPRRQGLHETAAAEWIKELSEIEDFRVLPKAGKNALYVTTDGYIRTGMKSGKSLDFMWRVGDTQFYAAHKYTKESGGNQDSQFIEMQGLLEHFQRGTEQPEVVLVVIVDGPYYTEARMPLLRRLVRDRAPRSYAMPIEELPDLFTEGDDA